MEQIKKEEILEKVYGISQQMQESIPHKELIKLILAAKHEKFPYPVLNLLKKEEYYLLTSDNSCALPPDGYPYSAEIQYRAPKNMFRGIPVPNIDELFKTMKRYYFKTKEAAIQTALNYAVVLFLFPGEVSPEALIYQKMINTAAVNTQSQKNRLVRNLRIDTAKYPEEFKGLTDVVNTPEFEDMKIENLIDSILYVFKDTIVERKK